LDVSSGDVDGAAVTAGPLAAERSERLRLDADEAHLRDERSDSMVCLEAAADAMVQVQCSMVDGGRDKR
jgi:hypothetical protein